MMKTKTKQLNYKSINDALVDLQAVDKGRYFLCTCPECKKDEAFIYKNNLNIMNCNRENECGERIVLEFKEKTDEIELKYQRMSEVYSELNDKQIKALDWINRAFEHGRKYFESKTFESNYRNISESVLREYGADFVNEELVGIAFKKIRPLLKKDYSRNDWMRKRNLMFAIKDDEGNIERMLFRSSIDPKIEPKEIQLIINPSKDTRDFFIDIPDDAKRIVFTESIIDAMSFKEIDPKVGIIALTGSTKLRKVSQYIKNNKYMFSGRDVMLAMDDDLAGHKASKQIEQVLRKNKVVKNLSTFDYGDTECKDPNELLQTNKSLFKRNYKNDVKKVLETENVVLCSGR